MKRLFLILLGGLTLSFAAHAASFDCNKATTKVEKLICADTAISKFDEELAAVYKTALQDEKQAEAVRQVQKQWLKERNGCSDAACVKRTYGTRLSSLKSSMTDGVTKQNVTTSTSKTKMALRTMSPVEDVACFAPKIDWRDYEWTLISGKGLAICEEMFAYVKSRPKNVAPPTCPEERLAMVIIS